MMSAKRKKLKFSPGLKRALQSSIISAKLGMISIHVMAPSSALLDLGRPDKNVRWEKFANHMMLLIL